MLMRAVQWNLSTPDTSGPEESVLNNEVSSYLRLENRVFWGWKKCHVYGGVLNQEVSLVLLTVTFREEALQ